MLRKCTQCGEEKPLERFVKQRGKYRSDPYRKDCKDCKNKKRRTGKPRSSFPKGQIPWNKGLKQRTSATRIYLPLTEEIKKKISISKTGIPRKEESNKKTLKTWLLKGFTFDRRSRTYQKWRKSVLERDKFKCQKCENIENLHVHHIIPWKSSVEKRMDIDNGQTLCRACHLSLEK